MKIRNNSRILALVLALVMILPLISIPVFANENEQPAPAAPLFSENFDGKTLDDVLVSKPASAQIVASGNEAHGDALQITVQGVGLTDYYLWSGNNAKWPITGTVVDGTLTGTSEKGDVVATKLPKDDNDASVEVVVGATPNPDTGVLEGGTTYKLVTGTYADSKGGFNNVAKAASFKNPQIDVAVNKQITIEMDLYLSADLKNTSGISGRMQAAKADGSGTQNVELFEITANGTQATISKHENATIALGESAKVALGNWVTITMEVNFETGKLTMLVNGEFAFRTAGLANTFAAISSLKENTLQVQIDRNGDPSTNNGNVLFDNVSIKDGLSGIAYDPFKFDPVILDFENEKVGAQPTYNLASNGGLADTTVENVYGSNAWKISFERPGTDNKYNIDKNPMIKNPATSYENYDKIVFETSYFFEPDAVGQIQTQFTSSTAFVGDSTAASSVSWVDLYQIYFNNGTATFQFEGGSDVGLGSFKFALGRWNTISVVIDLDTGMRDIYLNGELKLADQQLQRGGWLTNITIAANKMIIGGKVNKVTGAGTFYVDDVKFFKGDAPSVQPAAGGVEDFSAYEWIVGNKASGLQVPALATYKKLDDGNIVVNLPLAPAKGEEKYALLSEDGKKVYAWGITEIDYNDEGVPTYFYIPETSSQGADEFALDFDYWNELYYAYYEDKGERYNLNDSYVENEYNPDLPRYYLVTEAVAEVASAASSQIGVAFKVLHDKFSYKNDDKIVVLTADYFIEPGSKGIVEAQFEQYYYDVITTTPSEVEGGEDITTVKTETGNWIQLYYFDTETGQFEGLDEYMEIGAWNNVKVFMNLESGECEIYLNDILVKTENVGKTNLTIGQNAATSFSVAKIQRTTSLYGGDLAGNLMIDNVGLSNEIPADSQYGDGYLSDEAYLNSIGKLLFETVYDASVRFEGPNGIRFATKINDEFKAQLLANLGENAIVGMGTLIAPLDYVELAGKFNKEALAALETETAANYLDVPFNGYFEGAKGVDLGEGNYFTASIVNIKEENLMRDFAAIAYVTIQVAEGDVRTYYAKNYCAASAAYAAKATIAASETFDWNEEEQALLDAYAAADVEEMIWVDAPYGNSKNPNTEIVPMEENVFTVDGRLFFGGRFAGYNLKITGPEGFKVYYNGALLESVDGVLTIDSLALPEGAEPWAPITFGLFGSGDFTVYAEAPVGSFENPIVVESLADALTAAVPEDGAVYYKWIADQAGILTVTTATENAKISVNNNTLYLYETIEGAGSVKVAVGIGDEIALVVATVTDETTWTSPAGEVAVSFAFAEATMIQPPMMPNAPITFGGELAYGDYAVFTGYARMLAGKVFTMEAVEGLNVWYNGVCMEADEEGMISFTVVPSDFGTCVFVFKNNDEMNEEAIIVGAVIAEALGSMNNPDALDLGAASVTTLADGSYTYRYVAEAAGVFTFKVTSESTNWVFVVNNLTAGVYGDNILGDADPLVNSVELTVAEGDELVIVLGTLDYSVAEIAYEANFTAAE